MSYRGLQLCLGALILALVLGAPALADNPGDKAQGQEGKLVSVTGDKLVMKGKDGKEHAYTLAPDAKISCAGKVCKVEDLKPGMRISLTTHKEDLKVVTKVSVTKVEALRNDRKDQKAKDEANMATIIVTLPDGALLTFDGAATVSVGPRRVFTSPALKPGENFQYVVKATLVRDGKTETASKKITIRAGEETDLDLPLAKFSAAAGNGEGLTHKGKVVRVTANNLTMADKDGKNEHSHAVAGNTNITLDGKECKLEDLKPGMGVRVTTKEGDKDHTVLIEGTSAK